MILAIVFLSLTCLLYLGFQEDKQLVTQNQKLLYSLGFGGLLAGLVTLLLAVQTEEHAPAAKSKWFYPGWPVCLGWSAWRWPICIWAWAGGRPQCDGGGYASPVCAAAGPSCGYDPPRRKRTVFLDIGPGGSFSPLFAYYLSSPFSTFCLRFSRSGMFNEGILVITPFCRTR